MELVDEIYLSSSDQVIFSVNDWQEVSVALEAQCRCALLLSQNLLNHPDF